MAEVFDHASALSGVQRATLTPSERHVLLALIALSDATGKATASEELIGLLAKLIADVEADGRDPVAFVLDARRVLGGAEP